MFSWRQNSEQIFSKIFSSKSVDDSEPESESDDDDLTSSCSVFDQPATPKRTFTGYTFDSEIEQKLQKWIDLTNIDMGPFANPDRMRLAEKIPQKQACARSLTIGSERTEFETVKEVGNTVTLKFQYLIISEKLKVTLLRAQSLSAIPDKETDIEMQARFCLFPSKFCHKDTAVIRGCKSPEFNTVVYLGKNSLQEMHQKTLRITLYSREGQKGRFESVGEVNISLENFDLTAETAVEKSLETTTNSFRKSTRFSFK